MRNKQVSTTALILKMLPLFAILTVLQGVSFLDGINKIAIGVLSLFLVVHLLTCTYTVAQLVALFFTVVVYFFAIYFTNFPVYYFNSLFYFLLWVLLYIFFNKGKERIQHELRKSKGYIDFVLWTWTIIVGFSALLPSSYNGRFFLSFTGSSFRLMPTVLIITALAMYMVITKRDNRYNWFLLLPTYAAFMNESRTYFGVYVLFLVMYIYMLFRKKAHFYVMLGPIAGLIVLTMVNTGIMDKFLNTQYTDQSYFDFWGTVTSGRTVFWVADLEAFFALPVWQQFVGNGFNFVYDVNLVAIGNDIWAHNDFINILMNFGYVGLVLYFWAYHQLIKALWPKGNKIPYAVKMLFHIGVFFNSMMNMSYTYLCAMISYPLFMFVVNERYKENDVM